MSAQLCIAASSTWHCGVYFGDDVRDTLQPRAQALLALACRYSHHSHSCAGLFDAKVKVWPMKLNATTTANKDGVKPISWRITCERAWLV